MSTLKFCPECNNALHIEGGADSTVFYACSSCNYMEEADHNCVYRAEVDHSKSEEAESFSDSNRPRKKDVSCPKCQHKEAFFYQAKPVGEEEICLVFECCSHDCGHIWKAEE